MKLHIAVKLYARSAEDNYFAEALRWIIKNRPDIYEEYRNKVNQTPEDRKIIEEAYRMATGRTTSYRGGENKSSKSSSNRSNNSSSSSSSNSSSRTTGSSSNWRDDFNRGQEQARQDFYENLNKTRKEANKKYTTEEARRLKKRVRDVAKADKEAAIYDTIMWGAAGAAGGATLGSGIGAMRWTDKKILARLKKKYPNKSDAELHKMIESEREKLINRDAVIGLAAGAAIGGGAKGYYNYKKVKANTEKNKKIFKDWYRQAQTSYSLKGLNKLNTGISIAAGTVGLATGLVGLKKALQGNRFSVVWLTNQGKPAQKSVTANSPLEAVQKVNKFGGSKFRAFRMPDQDDQSQEYYAKLSRNDQ